MGHVEVSWLCLGGATLANHHMDSTTLVQFALNLQSLGGARARPHKNGTTLSNVSKSRNVTVGDATAIPKSRGNVFAMRGLTTGAQTSNRASSRPIGIENGQLHWQDRPLDVGVQVRDLTEHLTKTLLESEFSFTTTAEREFVRVFAK